MLRALGTVGPVEGVGGRTKAALRSVAGAEKVARFLVGVAQKALLLVELTAGQITGVQVHANPEKLVLACPGA